MGYLMRVAAANGFSSARQLLGTAMATDGTAFQQVCRRLLLTPMERQSLTGVLPRQWGMGRPPFGLSPSDFNHSCRRWCPACLRESAHWRGAWCFKLSCVCTSHSVWLHDRCPSCGQYQGWGGVELFRCACGVELASAETEASSATMVALSAGLCGEKAFHVQGFGIATMGVAALHRMVRYLGMFSLAAQPARPGQQAHLHRLATARELLTGMAWLIDDWPAHFHELLAEIQAQAAGTSRLQRAFWPLYRVLYADLEGEAFQFLRDEFEAYVHRCWWGLICERNRRLAMPIRTSHPRLTMRQVALAAEVQPSVVRHLVQAQLLPAAVTPHPSGRKTVTVHETELPGLCSATRGALPLNKAAVSLGLPERRVRQLIAAHVIRPLISRASKSAPSQWLIGADELARLSAPSLSRGITLRATLRYWRLSDDEAIRLVQAVLANAFSELAEEGPRVPIGEVRLDGEHLAGWLADFRFKVGAAFSIDAAAKRLGIKQQVAYELARRGILKATADPLCGLRVAADAIEHFAREFVSLAEYARSRSCAPRAVLSKVAARPVCGPSIDGSRQYFFRRADLEAELISTGAKPRSSPPGGLPVQRPCGDDDDQEAHSLTGRRECGAAGPDRAEVDSR